MFTNKRLAHLMNEWIRRYTENPEQFSHQWQTINQFLAERSEGKEPSYGDTCIAYLAELDLAITVTDKNAPSPIPVA